MFPFATVNHRHQLRLPVILATHPKEGFQIHGKQKTRSTQIFYVCVCGKTNPSNN